MSLRKSLQLTPAFLAAVRRNAQKSTGPKTLRGKARSSLNALKHGRFAQDLPAKLREAGIRFDVQRVAALRRAISIVFGAGSKSGQMLLKRLANQRARAIWRESQLRPHRPRTRVATATHARPAEEGGQTETLSAPPGGEG